MPIDLLFQAPISAGYPLALVFGEDAPTGPSSSVTFVATLPALVGALVASYSGNVARPLVSGATHRMQVAAECIVGAQMKEQGAVTLRTQTHAAPWQRAAGVLTTTRGLLPNQFDRLRVDHSATHDNAVALDRMSITGIYEIADRLRREVTGEFEEAAATSMHRHALYQDMLRRRSSALGRYQGAGVRVVQGHNDGKLKAGLPLAMYREAAYRGAWTPPAGIHTFPVVLSQPPCYDPLAPLDLLFYEPFAARADYLFRCGGWTPPGESTGDTIVIPVQRVYIVLNNVTLRRVDGNIPLPVFSASLSLSRADWTWSFGANLPRDAYDLLQPGSSGDPVEIEVTINGVPYRMLVEGRERSRSFGRASLGITCRGKAALLDAPYAPTMAFRNDQARTAQQIMGDVLTVNGQPFGWTVNFDLTDWLVPADVFSHSGTYISALNAIAAAAGGYLQPHNTLQQLTVMPGYPVAPWAWGDVVADYELPADVTTVESMRDILKPEYNRVFVAGASAGVLGQVTRAGTAGDLLASLVTDPLITHADAARQRGIAVLGDTGAQMELSLKLPVLAETGVIRPGKFVRYVDGAETRLGLVRSVSVEIGSPDVWQQITVETHL